MTYIKSQLSPELQQALKKIAAREGVSVASITRRALMKFVYDHTDHSCSHQWVMIDSHDMGDHTAFMFVCPSCKGDSVIGVSHPESAGVEG